MNLKILTKNDQNNFLLALIILIPIFRNSFINNFALMSVITIIVKTLLVFLFYYLNRDTIKLNFKDKKIKNRITIYLVLILLFIILEFLKAEEISDIKIVIFYLFMNFIPLTILVAYKEKIDLNSFILMFYRIIMCIYIASLIYSIILLIFHQRIEYINEQYFHVLKLSKNINLYQSVHDIYNNPTFPRLSSFFGNPNTFGFNSAITFMFSFYYFINSNKKIKNYVLLFLPMVGLLFTKSRASFIFTLSFLLVWIFTDIFTKKTIKLSKKNFLYMFLSCVIAIIFSYFLIIKRGTSSGRNLAWQYSINIISNSNLVIGSGIKGFTNKILLTYELGHAHNSILQVMGVGGLIYLSVLLFGNYKSLKVGMSKIQIDNKKADRFMISLLVSSYVYQLFEIMIFSHGWKDLLYLSILLLLTIE